MRHRKAGRRLGRPTAHREAMLCNMANSLLEHGRITTTIAKAKEARQARRKDHHHRQEGRRCFRCC